MSPADHLRILAALNTEIISRRYFVANDNEKREADLVHERLPPSRSINPIT